MRWLNFKPRKNPKTGRSKTERRRPMPRWARQTIKVGSVVAIFGCALGGPAWLWQSGWVAGAINSAFDYSARQLATAGFKVEHVTLQGRENESASRISRVIDIKRGTPILSVDLDDVRERLEALPWVRVASIQRKFPDTVKIQIVERRPMALWQRNKELVLVDDEGTVITSRNLGRFNDLLILVGKDAPAHGASLLSFLSLEPDLRKRVNAAVRIGNRRWNIRMDNGIDVRLPENNAIDAWHRLARLERKHQLLKQGLLSIDLRIPDQLIVRTRDARPGTERKVSDHKGKNT